MRIQPLSSVLLSLSVAINLLPLSGLQPVGANDRSRTIQTPRLKDLKRPATTVKEWLAQVEAQPAAISIQVKGVKVEQTTTGLDIILETQDGTSLQVDATKFRTEGNSLIADIPNAVLALPNAQTFSADNPTSEIANIRVLQLDVSTIRLSVTGNNALPQQEVTLKTGALAYSLNSEAAEPEEEIVVTGEGQERYQVPNASTATKTDTPLRDIPQSIQVVPQQVLRDRNVKTPNQAVETVSGVADGGDNGTPGGSRIIRGFTQAGNFRNGFRDVDFFGLTGVGTIEQVEVLKGPASVLYGAAEPGGIVNIVTKQPLSQPFYNLAFEAGNFGYYQPSIDFTGPLDRNKTALYRLIVGYQSSDGFQDFVDTNQTTIAPSFTFKLGQQTTLNLYHEYNHFNGDPGEFYTGVFSDGRFLPRRFAPDYPQFSFIDATTQKVGYTLNHQFSQNWQIRNNFALASTNTRDGFAAPLSIVDDRFLTDFDTEKRRYTIDNYFGQLDVLGKFNTGTISHQLLVGFDLNRNVQTFDANVADSTLPDLDIFNPNYFDTPPFSFVPFYSFDTTTQSYGVYFQDQVRILDNVKLLMGGRLDWVTQNVTNSGIDSPQQDDFAFNPRIGLVYQPSRSVSLYTSFSQSFNPSTGFNPDGEAFKPTKGTQFEVGTKVDFLDGKLSTTLAAYQLTKTNVTTPEFNNIGFSIQVGEQRSRGIELDVVGEVLPGWKIIGSYAYTDAEVTEDNSIPVGNRLLNVPKNQASLWTTYEIQKGSLKGVGFGLGLFYVDARAAFSDNSFFLPNYFRTDTAIYYRRNRFNAAINIRNLFSVDYFRASQNYNFGFQRGTPFTIIGSISWEF